MGNTVTRNALMGFSYQEWVYLNFVYKMDLDKQINYINAEIDREKNSETTNFDDIYLGTINHENYYVQVKDYRNINIDKVSIENNEIKIPRYKKINFDSNDINIIVLNSNFECDANILGIKAKIIDSIYFMPLTVDNSIEQIGKYSDIYRKDSIRDLIDSNIHDRQFEFYQKKLPPLNVYPIKLNQKTILMRNVPNQKDIKNGVHWCIGLPGIDKSHLVHEFEEKMDNLIIYRFHIGNDDKYYEDRLIFNNFLRDISYKLFNNASLYAETEIIKELESNDYIFIIDGLDHVENYMESEFDNFINFIESLNNTKTLIFSRPLKNYSDFEKLYKIRKWTKNETNYYLNEEYESLQEYNDIYEISDGYPIITYYLAEHVKKRRKFI